MIQHIEATNPIHQKLLTDPFYKEEVGDLSLDIQKIWSAGLPSSTVNDYVSIMKRINSRTHFDEKSQKCLDEVMPFTLENPEDREEFHHGGMKDGSTAFVLTKTFMRQTKKEIKLK